MGKKSRTHGVEGRLAALQQQSQDLSGPELLAGLRSALGDPSSFVVQAAADLIRELEPGECSDELVAAWDRFTIDGAETDPGCRAKQAIVDALNKSDYDEPDFFLRGMRYRQPEPVYGAPDGYEDMAGNLRGACAFGLIRTPLASPGVVIQALVDLLADPDHRTRAHAARAIAASGSAAALPLLRLKVHQGDLRFEVMGACFSGMLAIDPDRSAEFVAARLKSSNHDIAVEAAAALGESRTVVAAERLIEAVRTGPGPLREAFLISLGLSRHTVAIDYLVGLIESASPLAAVAVEALAPSRFYGGLRERVASAVAASEDPQLQRVFQAEFPE